MCLCDSALSLNYKLNIKFKTFYIDNQFLKLRCTQSYAKSGKTMLRRYNVQKCGTPNLCYLYVGQLDLFT